MHIVYSDEKQAFSGVVRYENLDASKHWLTHYGNYLYLKFIFDKSEDRVERHQASKEIAIAERKMTYWRRHPNFSLAKIDAGKAILHRQWEIKS
jgi:hypothetical protein